MIQVKKVLYILNPNTYIHCENDVFEVITKMIDSDGVESKKTVNVPALTIEQIVIFGPATVSDFLVGYCSKDTDFLCISIWRILRKNVRKECGKCASAKKTVSDL